MEYWKRAGAKTWREFKTAWGPHQLWIYIASPAAGVVYYVGRNAWRWKESLMDIGSAVVNGVLGFATALAGTYVISFFRSVKLLDDERAAEIASRDSTMSDLQNRLQQAAPQGTLIERNIRELVAKTTAEDKKLLEFFLLYGERDDRLISPAGLIGDALSNAIRHCKGLGLIEERNDRPTRIKYLGIPNRLEESLRRMLSEHD